MRSSFGLKVGLGVACVLAVIVLLVRSGKRGGEPQIGNEPVKTRELKTSERVQQRLQQLRGPGSMQTKDAMRDRIQARGSMPGASGQTAQRGRLGAPKVDARGQLPPNMEPGGPDEPPTLDEDPDDIPTLTHLALQDTDPERRLAAVTLLGSSEDPEVIPVLAQALSDEDEEVRMAALESLSDFTEEPPVEAIEKAVSDPAPDIRFEALSVLADIGGERARSAVEKALNDPDEEVRNLAEGILDLEEIYQEPGAQDDLEDQTPQEQPQPGQPLPIQPAQKPAK